MSTPLKLSLAANAVLGVILAVLLFKSPPTALTDDSLSAAVHPAIEPVTEQVPETLEVSMSQNTATAFERSNTTAAAPPVTEMQSLHAKRNEDRAPVSIPLALQEIDVAALNLTADQVTVLADIRESFVAAIGGPDQDARDPKYRQRWQRAQPESDDMIRGLLGVQTWLDIESQTGTAPAAQTN